MSDEFEKEVAMYEAERNRAWHSWFAARGDVSPSDENTRIFDGGFRMAWELCRAQPAPGEEAMRDEVAIEAMKIFLQNALDHEIDFDGYESFEEMIADQAYLMADAMRNRSIQFTEPTPPTGERNE